MGSGLPGHLFQTYASYKIGTRDVVQWLCQNTGRIFEAHHVDSIWKLEHLTEVAVQKRISVPSKVLRTLRKTIKERSKIGAYFQKISGVEQRETNSSHSHFTSILLGIYQKLCSLVDTDDKGVPVVSRNQKSPLESSNMFAWLDGDDAHADPGSFMGIDRELVGASSILPSEPRPTVERAGNHDIISEFMALSMYLSQLDKLFCVVQDSWQAVRAGAMPVVVASFTTSISYQCTDPLRSYLDEYSIQNPKTLLARYETCVNCINSEASWLGHNTCSIPRLESVPFAKAEDLQTSWLALQDFKQSWEARSTTFNISNRFSVEGKLGCSSPPYDNIRQLFPGPEGKHKTDSTPRLSVRDHLDMILERMGQLIISLSQRRAREPGHTPLLGELKLFLQKDDGGSVDMIGLSFGLLLLLESLESYYRPTELFQLNPPHSTSRVEYGILTPPPSRGDSCQEVPSFLSTPIADPSPSSSQEISPVERKSAQREDSLSNCRIVSLRFGQDIKIGIEELLRDPNAPCGCLHVGEAKVLDLLGNCHRLVTEFTEVKNFDVFHQAPWVSGMDMLQNLIRVSDCGPKSWHHGYFVGTVMHIYNCLVRLGALSRDGIPLMESLCSIFSDSVFLGPRPWRNLWSCYQRWCGAKLSFPGSKCHDMHLHTPTVFGSAKKWKMESVHDVSQGGNDRKRSFDAEKVSILLSAVSKNSVTDDELLVRIYNSSKSKSVSRSDIKKARSLMKSDPFIAQHILRVQAAVLEEFHDECPIAKLNYFKLYETCCEVLRRISSFTHDVQEEGHICSGVAQSLIYETDQRLDRLRPVGKPQKGCILHTSAEAFLDVLQDKTLLDFTWQV